MSAVESSQPGEVCIRVDKDHLSVKKMVGGKPTSQKLLSVSAKQGVRTEARKTGREQRQIAEDRVTDSQSWGK